MLSKVLSKKCFFKIVKAKTELKRIHSKHGVLTNAQRITQNSILFSSDPTATMHIHPSSPNSSQSEDDAATKIQAGFRGYRVRKQLKQARRSSNRSKENEYLNGNMNGGVVTGPRRSIEEKSATKIQAGIRGFLVRKRQKAEKEAAIKIQASFRGFKTRKELFNNKKKERSIN